MAERLSNPIPLLVAGVTTAILFGFLQLAGSAVVSDETGGVASAAIVDGHGREQPLRRLWSGHFYAIPDMEGEIEVRCRDGARKQAGYVTPHLHTRIRVVGPTRCAELVDE